jgi:hypothetical protein
MTVYQFLYCDNTWESGFITISLHFSKEGAYNAMRTYLLNGYNEWYSGSTKNFRKSCRFGKYQAWKINPIQIQP